MNTYEEYICIYIYNTPWFGIPAPQVLMSLEGPLQPHHELVTGCYLWEVGNLKLQRAFGELNDVDWCERRLWTIGVLKKQWLNNSLNLGVVTIVYVFVVDILLLLPLTKIQDLQIAAFLKQLWIPAGQVDSGKLVRWQEGGADLTVPRCPPGRDVMFKCGGNIGVSLNGDTPNLHPKMIIFSRKTNGCWGNPAF